MYKLVVALITAHLAVSSLAGPSTSHEHDKRQTAISEEEKNPTLAPGHPIFTSAAHCAQTMECMEWGFVGRPIPVNTCDKQIADAIGGGYIGMTVKHRGGKNPDSNMGGDCDFKRGSDHDVEWTIDALKEFVSIAANKCNVNPNLMANCTFEEGGKTAWITVAPIGQP